MAARDMTFTRGDIIEIDNGRFVDCRFDGATLHYLGGPHPEFENCTFDNVAWHFGGAALRTIQLLQRMKGTPGGEAFVDDIFAPGKMFGDD